MKTFTIWLFRFFLLMSVSFFSSFLTKNVHAIHFDFPIPPESVLEDLVDNEEALFFQKSAEIPDCLNAIEIFADTIPTGSNTELHNQIEKEEEVFMIVEDPPRFPGCEHLELSKFYKENCAERKLNEYVYGNLRYPEEAIKKFIEGKVIVQFVIDKDGTIDDVKIVKDIGGGCGEEVVRVIENMNKLSKRWKPGKQRGRNIRVKYTLPVRFNLTD